MSSVPGETLLHMADPLAWSVVSVDHKAVVDVADGRVLAFCAPLCVSLALSSIATSGLLFIPLCTYFE